MFVLHSLLLQVASSDLKSGSVKKGNSVATGPCSLPPIPDSFLNFEKEKRQEKKEERYLKVLKRLRTYSI